MSGETVIQNVFTNPSLGETVPFQEFVEPGRKNVEFFPLYTTDQTGPEGPTAMLLHYRPGATNQRHIHPSYELILVLDGELVDDNGHYGPGTLLVSPPGSKHAASSPKGCTILIIWEKPVQRLLQEPQEASVPASA